MFQNLGFQELVVLLVIVLLIFGPKNLPKIGQALGKSIREFKNATREMSDEFKEDEDEKSGQDEEK